MKGRTLYSNTRWRVLPFSCVRNCAHTGGEMKEFVDEMSPLQRHALELVRIVVPDYPVARNCAIWTTDELHTRQEYGETWMHGPQTGTVLSDELETNIEFIAHQVCERIYFVVGNSDEYAAVQMAQWYVRTFES